MKIRKWFAWGLLLLGPAACTRMPDKPSLSPVRGTVTYKGQVITEGSIEFEPENPAIHRCSSAIKDGQFDMYTLAGTTKPDGGMPGKYKVAVTGTVGKGKDAPKVPKRYGDVSTSGLTAEVKSGGDTNMTIDIK
jgi:hypothetical protein